MVAVRSPAAPVAPIVVTPLAPTASPVAEVCSLQIARGTLHAARGLAYVR
jgi:hypothetical protein